MISRAGPPLLLPGCCWPSPQRPLWQWRVVFMSRLGVTALDGLAKTKESNKVRFVLLALVSFCLLLLWPPFVPVLVVLPLLSLSRRLWMLLLRRCPSACHCCVHRRYRWCRFSRDGEASRRGPQNPQFCVNVL